MKKRDIRLLAFIAAAVFIIAGIVLKQPAAVLAKAAKICMECVGIG